MADDAHRRTLGLRTLGIRTLGLRRFGLCTLGLCLLCITPVAAAGAAQGHSELSGHGAGAEAGPAAGEGSASSSSTATGASGSPTAGGSSAAASATASQQSGGAGTSAQAHGTPSNDTSASSDTRASADAQTSHKKEAVKPKHSHESGLQGRGAQTSASGAGDGTTAGENTGAGVGTSAPTASSPVVSTPDDTAAAATSAVPAAATPTSPGASASPVATSTNASRRARHTRTHRGSASARRRERAGSAEGSGSLAPLGAASTDATASTSSRPGVHAHGATADTHSAEPLRRPSPIVTTITKIVGVVPTAVRELILALLALALALGVRSRFAALRERRLERQRAGLLEEVGLLQAALLPTPPARLGPVGTSVAYEPAAGPGAGGDFYDVFALADGQLAVIVGDISGHGREALPHTALVRFTLRAYLEAGLSPRDVLQTAGAVLERQLGDVFATVVVATYNPRERVLVYACAGHPPPVVLGSSALAPITVSASPPIGVGMRTGMRQTAVAIPGRAHICFYTDGLTEARVDGGLFGTERLEQTLAALGPRASAPALLARVAELADARPDDMAACVLSVEGDAGAPALLLDELELERDDVSAARAERFLLACGARRDELDEAMRAARAVGVRTGAAVLQVRHARGTPPHVTVQREQVTHLRARPANVAVAL
jgi:serine phosphatase RsbU (regulator of sigma subunit)